MKTFQYAGYYMVGKEPVVFVTNHLKSYIVAMKSFGIKRKDIHSHELPECMTKAKAIKYLESIKFFGDLHIDQEKKTVIRRIEYDVHNSNHGSKKYLFAGYHIGESVSFLFTNNSRRGYAESVMRDGSYAYVKLPEPMDRVSAIEYMANIRFGDDYELDLAYENYLERARGAIRITRGVSAV